MNQRLQLIGLLTVAYEHVAATDAIKEAMLAIVKERDQTGKLDHYGKTMDLLYIQRPATPVREIDALLLQLNIKVNQR